MATVGRDRRFVLRHLPIDNPLAGVVKRDPLVDHFLAQMRTTESVAHGRDFAYTGAFRLNRGRDFGFLCYNLFRHFLTPLFFRFVSANLRF